MSIFYWGITIDTEDSGNTDASIGLYSGVFYWITGRPDFDGSEYIGDAPVAAWKEGIITSVNDISPITRIAKGLRKTGGYGTLSGFDFSIDNTSGLNNTLESNGYFIVNRTCNVYCFITDSGSTGSLLVWSGVISESNISGLKIELKCEDGVKNIHKELPPNLITSTIYANINEEYVGEPIPITFGNVLRSKVIPVEGIAHDETIALLEIDSIESKHACARRLSIQDNQYTIDLYVNYMNFPENYFIDNGVYYLVVTKGEEQSIRILGSSTMTNAGLKDAFVTLTLAEQLSGIDSIDDFNANNDYVFDDTTVKDDVWIFKIIKLDVKHIVSNLPIYEYPKDVNGNYEVEYFDEESNVYRSIDELVENVDTTAGNDISVPNISLQHNNINIEGDFKTLVKVVPNSVKLLNVTINNATTNNLASTTNRLIDRDYTTYSTIEFPAGIDHTICSMEYLIEFPSDIDLDGFEDVYLLMDQNYNSDLVGNQYLFQWRYKMYDPYLNLFLDTSVISEGFISNFPETLDFNFLPYQYYTNTDLTHDTYFNKVTTIGLETQGYIDMCKLDSTILSTLRSMTSLRYIYMKNDFVIYPGATLGSATYNFRQIGFMCTKKMNTIKNEIYAKVKGETV